MITLLRFGRAQRLTSSTHTVAQKRLSIPVAGWSRDLSNSFVVSICAFAPRFLNNKAIIMIFFDFAADIQRLIMILLFFSRFTPLWRLRTGPKTYARMRSLTIDTIEKSDNSRALTDNNRQTSSRKKGELSRKNFNFKFFPQKREASFFIGRFISTTASNSGWNNWFASSISLLHHLSMCRRNALRTELQLHSFLWSRARRRH